MPLDTSSINCLVRKQNLQNFRCTSSFSTESSVFVFKTYCPVLLSRFTILSCNSKIRTRITEILKKWNRLKETSLPNYVIEVFACFACLVCLHDYMLGYFSSLRACVLSCLECLCVYVFACLMSCVLTCSRTHAHMFLSNYLFYLCFPYSKSYG